MNTQTYRFRRGYGRAIIGPVLDYHQKTKTPFLINPYFYFGFAPKTLNYKAMRRLGYGYVDIVVTKTGCPSVGDPDQAAVKVENV
ncbi:Glucan endo-1,3-beta-glucosidase [Acorus calamus]|uniref:Glucan endo-1,3-beta-glucosidase n=1 Tax=Acorus calamus TaxID=4465 RepID=A0AAV9D6L2_ACOCL|nr:Glucan endo-1,3-beta-glucosidase [Acorus calamus]